MKIAYMVQAHKNYEQLCLLINNLEDENVDLYIHIDKKNDSLYKELKSNYCNKKNVYLVENRVDVNWAGFSQVQATLNMIYSVVNSNKVYDYVSLISGQDFPIKSNKDIERIITENKGKEFIEYKDIGNHEWRLKCYNLFSENKNNRKLYTRIIDNILRIPQKKIPRRKNFENLKLYYGSQWFTLTYECIEYIYNFLNTNRDYIGNFKYTTCADEHFFQILIMNSEFKKNVVNNNLRYIDWSEGKNSPKTLVSGDLKYILKSKKIIARKFDMEVDKNIMISISNRISTNN